ncbi:methylated-DNA-[protein]-cysteine S-methyltransferase [Pullulanibacillus pueri]|uniref:Methylated-DNA--protein-cysteine methyltransferase n=1 Tax=Pullulanibacillus pueri TaxID=1437324 RepID=A0A8J2ZZJ0_9BACL|nr:methylated-DNA--[protein]-cysteine S-methyltransferase [Pullulanibacillus pueri]MBM7683913.1 methylated-DNA-[protein]-cysteine S-methyltransferase [Pullulanibacillus pueri]GGH87794.1 methylated-DNA--protein-cysteine methyltransferase [Pullulanibacillus pueri]
MNTLYKTDYPSQLGIIEIVGSEKAVHSILFSDREQVLHPLTEGTPGVLVDCVHQLHGYFNGQRRQFTFPYTFEGTHFQKKVWQALTHIPYAQTVSYKDIAVSIGNEKAVRAVGSANGKNKLSIVIPCHRIIGADGTLTGYAGGLWRKEWLLEHERAVQRL